MQKFKWDLINQGNIGQYLTSIQSYFIDQSLQQEPQVQNILDVGGGTGRFAIPLEKKGYDVTVTEIGPRSLQLLKNDSPSIGAILVDPKAQELPIKDASIDCVLAIEVPIKGIQRFSKECRRVLKPEGMVIISGSNRNSYKSAFHKVHFFLAPFLSKREKSKANRRSFYNLAARETVKIFEENNLHLDQALGFNWLPVSRTSDSFLIPPLAALEQTLGLRRFPFQSPWVILKFKAR